MTGGNATRGSDRSNGPSPPREPVPPGSRRQEVGVILIAHGSRLQDANDELHAVAADLRAATGRRVQAAFLELASPSIGDAGEVCVLAGCNLIILAPYFLSAGIHAAQDLEEERKKLALRFPDREFRLAKPLGPHPLLVEILRERIGDVLTGNPIQVG